MTSLCRCGQPTSMVVNNEPLCAEHAMVALRLYYGGQAGQAERSDADHADADENKRTSV